MSDTDPLTSTADMFRIHTLIYQWQPSRGSSRMGASWEHNVKWGMTYVAHFNYHCKIRYRINLWLPYNF